MLVESPYPAHEIGTHTFSHYYCLEEGQNIDSFRDDIKAAKKIAKKYNVELTSLVFPRNQFNEEYLRVCSELGIICIRGNETSWLYKARTEKRENLLRRALRLMDAYVNLTGHNCYGDDLLKNVIWKKYCIIISTLYLKMPQRYRIKKMPV